MRGKNSWLSRQGNRPILSIFAKPFLVNYSRQMEPDVEDKDGTIRTFDLPFDVATRHAARVLASEKEAA